MLGLQALEESFIMRQLQTRAKFEQAINEGMGDKIFESTQLGKLTAILDKDGNTIGFAVHGEVTRFKKEYKPALNGDGGPKIIKHGDDRVQAFVECKEEIGKKTFFRTAYCSETAEHYILYFGPNGWVEEPIDEPEDVAVIICSIGKSGKMSRTGFAMSSRPLADLGLTKEILAEWYPNKETNEKPQLEGETAAG